MRQQESILSMRQKNAISSTWQKAAIFVILATLLPPCTAYKIKRTECSIEEGSDEMICSCGGIGDPFAIILNRGPNPDMGLPFYGTRYGHNFALQIKQALVDRNLTTEFNSINITRLRYHNCTDHPLRMKLDFSEFIWDPVYKVDLRGVREILFSEIHSVNLFLTKVLNWGSLTLTFRNINSSHNFGSGHDAGVVIRGKVAFCRNPCRDKEVNITAEEGDEIDIDDNPESEDDRPAPVGKTGSENRGGMREFMCNMCSRNSKLQLVFENVTEVQLSDFLVPEDDFGETSIETNNVSIFSIEGGEYSGLKGGIVADTCTAYDEITNCTVVLELGAVDRVVGGVTAVVLGAVGVILVFIVVVGALTTFKLKPVIDYS